MSEQAAFRGSPAPAEAPAPAGAPAPTGALVQAPAQAGASAPAQAGASAPAQAGASAPAQAGASAPAQAGASAPAQARSPILAALSPHRHAVIEASAGTGKTYTLELLVIELLLGSDVELDGILVVTYTERAAQELRARLRARIREMHAAPGLPAAAREKLGRALVGFDLAAISTIHAFCQRMLSENAFAARRLFEQVLVDGRTLFSRSFMLALRTRLACDAGEPMSGRAFLAEWLREGSLAGLEKLLYTCHERRGEFHPTFSTEAVLEAVRALAGLPLTPATLERQLRQAKVHGGTVNAVVARYERLRALAGSVAQAADLPGFLAGLPAKNPLGFLLEKEDKLAVAAPELPALLRRICAVAPSFECATAQVLLPPVVEVLAREKARTGEIDFGDMLALLWDSLDAEPVTGRALVRCIQQRFRFALIDEFQDTDDVQWRIMRRLFLEPPEPGPGPGPCPPPNRLYVIGDPKQAIYGFRGADVKTYLAAIEEIRVHGGDRLSLTSNHRSSAALVAALEAIFDPDADPPFFRGDIRYAHPVTAARPPEPGPPPVHLFRLTLPADARSTSPAKQALGRRIAQEVAELLAGCGPFPVAASEIFVLTRSGAESVEIGRHLARAGLPYAFYKLDGLFQTEEARHVLDLLAGVATPEHRPTRYRAWLTPFFAVPITDLPACAELPGTHPLLARLFEWRALAEARDYDRLFTAILDGSGLVRRELFLSARERALTNYLHIFELLLEEANRTRATLEELVHMLAAFIEGRRAPEGEDGNVQRLESERAAVQLTTMHKSKGLEAKVVFLFGAFENGKPEAVQTYHEGGQRRLTIGPPHPLAEQERDEEDQRLLYVALTRARERLYLPHLVSRPKRAGGICARLLGPALDRVATHPGFTSEEVPIEAPGTRVEQAVLDAAVAAWTPPADLLPRGDATAGGEPGDLARLRALHTGFRISSYSGIKAAKGGYQPPASVGRGAATPRDDARASAPADPGGPIPALVAPAGASAPLASDDLDPDVDALSPAAAVLAPEDLPGGPASGRFIHEVLEKLPLDTLREGLAFELWAARRDVIALFTEAARNHDRDLRHLQASQALAWAALTRPLPLGRDGGGAREELEGGVAAAARVVREMEFLYPVPGTPEFIKGYVDVVFEHRGKVYILDWKTDLLPGYGADELEVHATQNYALQGSLYTLALVRMLRLGERAAYEARFGGVLFCFVRGMAAAPTPHSGRRGAVQARSPGVLFKRPSWHEVLAGEAELRGRGDLVRAEVHRR